MVAVGPAERLGLRHAARACKAQPPGLGGLRGCAKVRVAADPYQHDVSPKQWYFLSTDKLWGFFLSRYSRAPGLAFTREDSRALATIVSSQKSV